MAARINKLAGLALIVSIGGMAGGVGANECFFNVTLNTCSQLPVSPLGKCYLVQSNNSCQIGIPGPFDVDMIGSPTTAECTYKLGVIIGGNCLDNGAPAQTSSVQCAPAVGAACGEGGGEP